MPANCAIPPANELWATAKSPSRTGNEDNETRSIECPVATSATHFNGVISLARNSFAG